MYLQFSARHLPRKKIQGYKFIILQFQFFSIYSNQKCFPGEVSTFYNSFLFPNNLRFQESLAKLGTCKVQKTATSGAKCDTFDGPDCVLIWMYIPIPTYCTDLDVPIPTYYTDLNILL